MNYNYKEIGKRIKSERKLLGKSQEELSGDLKVKRSTVGSWENGKTLPSFQTMINMCKMFNCEMGYLLCEEGYEEKTRKITDICRETGLSAEAVEILMEEKKRLNKIDEWNEKKNWFVEHKSRSLMLEVIERIIKNDKYIQTEIEKLKTNKWNIKGLEEDENFKDIEKAFNEALKEKISWQYADGGFFEEAERKEIFLDKLKENAIKYYDSNEYKKANEELIAMLKEGNTLARQYSGDGAIQVRELTEDDIKLITEISPEEEVKRYTDRHFQDYEVLFKRAELEKEELAIGLKFQKIVNDVIESLIS